RAYREFYRWRAVWRSSSRQPTLPQRARHLAYAGAWKHFEPVWDVLIRSRRVNAALPLLEATLAAFGGRPSAGSASGVRDDVHLAPAEALQLAPHGCVMTRQQLRPGLIAELADACR